MLKILWEGIEILIVYFLVSFFFAMTNRIILYDENSTVTSDTNSVYFAYSNGSTARALFSIWIGDPATNFPDWVTSLLTVSKSAGYLVVLQLFFNKQIVGAFIMTHLYFYYKHFYDHSLLTLKSEPRLYYVLAKEFAYAKKNIHDDVLTYIVNNYCVSIWHSFYTDEDFLTLRNLHLSRKLQSKGKLEKRRNFFRENFGRLRKWYKNKGWRIFMSVVDVFQCVA